MNMKKKDKEDENLSIKKNEEDENLSIKKNEDWWRLEKFQIGRSHFS
jgi:hypothetical protein